MPAQFEFPSTTEQASSSSGAMPQRNNNDKTFIGIGEVLWDVLPQEMRAGGAPFNFALVSSLLGAKGIIASRIGLDDLGNRLSRTLSQLNLGTSIQEDPVQPTGTAVVTVAGQHEASYAIPYPAAWDELEWTSEWANLAQRADVVCFGTLAQRSLKARTTIDSFLRSTRSDCVRIFDVNIRAPFYSPEVIANSLELADIVKLSEREFAETMSLIGLAGTGTADDLKGFAQRFGLQLVCLTRGNQGSILATSSRAVEHPGFAVEVKNTVGVGDAFAAAVAHSWLSHKDLERTSAVANCWGAWIVSQNHLSAVQQDGQTIYQKMMNSRSEELRPERLIGGS
jgi:fructokinase